MSNRCGWCDGPRHDNPDLGPCRCEASLIIPHWHCVICDIVLGPDDADVPEEHLCTFDADARRCRECGEPNDDGEGYDGLCGNCADLTDTDRADESISAYGFSLLG
jgi:hypothetical protein